jgi:uncharacterized membrane protein (DUF106 family)
MTTASRVVIGGNYCHWKTKINTQTKGKKTEGFISPWLVVALFLIGAGIYLYFINSSAVKGYEMRSVEKEITDLKKESEELRMKEAELKSLYRIEESSKELNMAQTSQVSYIEEKGPMAMR